MDDDSNAPGADPNFELGLQLEMILYDCLMRGVVEADVKVLCYATGIRWERVAKQEKRA